MKKQLHNLIIGIAFFAFIWCCQVTYETARQPYNAEPAKPAYPTQTTKVATVATPAVNITQYLPKSAIQGKLLRNTGYVSYFSEDHQIPVWVAYIAKYPFEYNTVERPSTFYQDPRVKSPQHSDYTRSGFDRGHMAPNYVIGRCYGERAQYETFYTTNIIPQKAKVNRNQWMEMEQFIANKLAARYGEVFVLVGPVITNNVSKIKGKITIPPAMWAIVAVRDRLGNLSMAAILIPQEPTKKDFRNYITTVDNVEAETGIDFFSELPDQIENQLEATRNRNLLN